MREEIALALSFVKQCLEMFVEDVDSVFKCWGTLPGDRFPLGRGPEFGVVVRIIRGTCEAIANLEVVKESIGGGIDVRGSVARRWDEV